MGGRDRAHDRATSEPRRAGAGAGAVQSSGRARWLAEIAEAAMQVEAAVGIRPVARVDALTGVRAGIGSRLLPGPARLALLPAAPAVVQAGLGVAGTRGLPAPMRRWRPAVGGIDLLWRPTRRIGRDLRGAVWDLRPGGGRPPWPGDVAALAPPPGGALVLRAWRARGTWGAALGLVLGAAETLGLGREAGRVAARARNRRMGCGRPRRLGRAGPGPRPVALARRRRWPQPRRPLAHRWRPCSRPASPPEALAGAAWAASGRSPSLPDRRSDGAIATLWPWMGPVDLEMQSAIAG